VVLFVFSLFRLWSNATNRNTYSSLLIQYIWFSQDFASAPYKKTKGVQKGSVGK